jgi:glutamyl-tRNA reductase
MYDFFPFYINIQKKYFLIVGGGKIACRRLKTLLKFDVNVVLIAPDISPEIKLIQNERLRLYEQAFEEKFLDKINYLILATDDKDLHKAVSELARKKGISVNDASCKENCDFYFPSIIDKDELLISVTSLGNNHKLTHRIANIIRKYINKFTTQTRSL